MRRSELLQALKPFFLRWLEQGADAGLTVGEGPGIDLVGHVVGLGGDRPLRYRADGEPVAEYATAAAACAAGGAGEKIELQAGTYTEDLTVPAGATLMGQGQATVIAGTVTLGDGAAIVHCDVLRDEDTPDDVVCIVPPDEGMAYVHSCHVAANNATGAGYAVYGARSHVTISGDSRMTAQSAGVDSNPFSGAAEEDFVSNTTDVVCLDLWNGSDNDSPPADWDELAYDDSAWAAPVVSNPGGDPYLSGDMIGAYLLWNSVEQPRDESHRVIFRHVFTVPATVEEATLYWDADNWTEGIYVNGTLVDQWHYMLEGDDHPIRSVDVTAYLTPGASAIIAVDQTSGVYDALYSTPDSYGQVGWRLVCNASSGAPYVYSCEIPNAEGRAAAVPLYGDRASWRTDYADGATHADDWDAGDSHHAAVTLAAGSPGTLDGQELDLSDVGGGSGWGAAMQYPAIPTLSTVTEDGYADEYTNSGGKRWQALASREIGGTLYQVCGYWDADGYLTVAVRVPPGPWTIHTFSAISVTGADAHDTVSVGIDPAGYIHVCYDHHNDPLHYRRSATPLPWAAGELTAALSMLGTNETSVTYPTFFNDPLGSLYVMFRDSAAAASVLRLYVYDEDAQAWSAATGTGSGGALIQGTTTMVPYHHRPAFDADWDGAGTGKMHLFWVWYDSSIPAMVSLQYAAWIGTTWEQADGGAQTVPITTSNEETVDTPSTAGYSGWFRLPYVAEACSDAEGHPHLGYGRAATDGYTHIYHLWHNGTSWVLQQVTDTALDPDEYPISCLTVLDRRTNTVRLLYRDPLDTDSAVGLLMQTSDPGDYTTWTKSVLYDGDLGDWAGDAAYASPLPKSDAYQWEEYHRLSLLWEEWESGQAALPIYLIEWYPSEYALLDAAGYPDLHANDTDTATTTIHHTLGTGANQAAAGDHTHEGLGGVGELLVQDGASAPPVTLTNEAEDDWLYADT